MDGITLYLKESDEGYYHPSIKLFGFLPLGRMIFGNLLVSMRCQSDNTFAVVRDGSKQFSIAWKVESDRENPLNNAWLGEYLATQTEARTDVPRIRVWEEGGFFFAETRQFPVHYLPQRFLLNRSSQDSAQFLYSGNRWGPKMVFSEAGGNVSMAFMGYTFYKQ